MEEQGRSDEGSVFKGSGGDEEITGLIRLLITSKVSKFKKGDLEIEFSPLAFIPTMDKTNDLNQDNIDDLVYYSSNNRPR